MQIEIFPTNTCPSDYPELVRRAKAFADFSSNIHIDLSDGKFTSVTSWPYGEGQWAEIESMADRKESLPLARPVWYETHLMVEAPLRIGTFMARIGVKRVLAHAEVFKDVSAVQEAFSAWRAGGAHEVGLAFLVDTPIEILDRYAPLCDSVLLMSIPTLGKQGAQFDERIYERIKHVHETFPELSVAVDGGVSAGNIERLVHSGARRFGVGSAITKTPNPTEAYAHLLELAQGAI